MSTLVVLVAIKAKPGCEQELQSRLRALVAPSLNEQGCLGYRFLRVADDPSAWLLHESWESREDLDRHCAAPHLCAFREGMHEVLACEMTAQFFTPDTEPLN